MADYKVNVGESKLGDLCAVEFQYVSPCSNFYDGCKAVFDNQVESITVSGSTYVADAKGRLIVSSDDGLSWSKIDCGFVQAEPDIVIGEKGMCNSLYQVYIIDLVLYEVIDSQLVITKDDEAAKIKAALLSKKDLDVEDLDNYDFVVNYLGDVQDKKIA